MKQLHHPKDAKTYVKGANRDIEKEYINLDDGSYVDACNMRPINTEGDNGALAKMNGEEVKFNNVDNSCILASPVTISTTYKCIGTIEIHSKIVEFWADSAGSDDPFIRVDGLVVLKSAGLPIGTAAPLQMDKNEACVGGEVYATDYVTSPMFFNIDDMLKNAGYYDSADCTGKYFSEFNLAESQLKLEGHLNAPRFVALETAGSSPTTYRDRNGSGGLPVGVYAYAIRYVDATGNATNIGMFSPTIPVVKLLSPDTPHYPYAKTYGDAPNTANPTTYSIRLKIRVNNLNNYERLEVVRVLWASGTAIGTPPAGEVILKIPLNKGEVGSFEVEDASINSIETVTDEVSDSQIGGLKRAKAIRFFENKLYFGNIEYNSKDVQSGAIFPSGTATLAPTIESLGKAGHNEPYNYAYYKSYMSSERQGFGILFLDNEGNRSFVVPIPGAENLEMAARRDPITQLTADTSIKGASKDANSLGGITHTHEVFDLEDANFRTERCKFMNMSTKGVKCGGEVADGRSNFNACSNTTDEQLEDFISINIQCGAWTVKAEDLKFRALHPYTPADSSWQDHEFNPTQKITTGADKIRLPARHMFAPNYFAKGFTIDKVDVSAVPWASSFSIVRTLPAKRVQVQGMASWSLNAAKTRSQDNVSKDANKVWFYASDADQTMGLDPTLFSQIQNGVGTGEYTLKVESPLGFSSDYYNFNEKAGGSVATFGLDIISYVRLKKDDISTPLYNPLESSTMGINDGNSLYVAFGKWRQHSGYKQPNPFPSFTNPSTFKITGINLIQGTGTTAGGRGGHYWELTLDKNIYTKINLNGTPYDFVEEHYKNFQEPFYIASILRETNNIDASPQTQDYISTGHSQQIKSLVAVSPDDNTKLNVDLVDERWEDCIPDLIDSATGNPYKETKMSQSAKYYTKDRFVKVVNENNDQLNYMNVTFHSVSQINQILSDIASTGSSLQSGRNVVGIYRHIDTTGNQRFQLQFDVNGWASGVNVSSVPKETFIPKKSWKVYVEYNPEIPIRFFGGDTYVGENVHAVYDVQYGTDGTPYPNDEHRVNIGLPYREVTPNKRMYMMRNAVSAAKDNIQSQIDQLKHDDSLGAQPGRIRQWLLMYTVESRLCSPYFYGDVTDKATLDTFFPITHYRQRPHKWKGSDPYKLVDPGYQLAYGDEAKHWKYGGFRFRPLANTDYSQYNNFGIYTSKPKTGFKDETLYCTRVIWSQEKPINVQDSPNVRSFPALNIYDISDDTGEIKHMYDSDSSKGNNLFAFTEDGTVMLLTDKRILSQLSGGQLAAIESPTRGIQKQIWISKVIGMSDELWRTAAEYSNEIYFANLQSVYVLKGVELIDIKNKYQSKIYYNFLQNLKSGYDSDVTGVFNELHREYWITFSDEDNNVTIPPQSKVTINYTAPSAGFIGEMRFFNFNGSQTVNNGHLGINSGNYYLLNNLTTDLDYFSLGSTMINVGNITLHASSNPVNIKDTITGTDYLLEADKSYLITPIREGSADIIGFTVEEVANIWKGEKEQKCVTIMYSKTNNQWIGTNAHDFDRYLSFDNRLYGMREAMTYELNKGDLIYNAAVDAYVINASSGTAAKKSATQNIKGDASMDKEFLRFRLSSDNKPNSIEFFETEAQMDADTPVCTLIETNLKDYHGFEQYIPRKVVDRKRLQGRIMFFKVNHNKLEEFKIIGTEVQYKTLK